MKRKLVKCLTSAAMSFSMLGSVVPVLAQTNVQEEAKQEEGGWKYLKPVEGTTAESTWAGKKVYYTLYPCGWHDDKWAGTTSTARFQASSSASLKVSTNNKVFSGIVVGWTHYYDGVVTGSQSLATFDKGTYDNFSTKKYETGKIWLEENKWDGYVLDGWYTALEGGTRIEDNKLPDSFTPIDPIICSNPDDKAEVEKTNDALDAAYKTNALYLHWHKADNPNINQKTWAENYKKSLYYQIALPQSDYYSCEGARNITIEANLINAEQFVDPIVWSADNGATITRGNRYAVVHVPAGFVGDIHVTAEIDKNHPGKTSGLDEAPEGIATKATATIHSIRGHKYQTKLYSIPGNTHSQNECAYCGKVEPGSYNPNPDTSSKKPDTQEEGSDKGTSTTGNNGNSSTGGSSVSSSTNNSITPDAQAAPSQSETEEGKKQDELSSSTDTETKDPSENQSQQNQANNEPEQDQNQTSNEPSQKDPDLRPVETPLPEEKELSKNEVDSTTAQVGDSTMQETTFDDDHKETKVESQQAVSNYIETSDHTFAGAQVEIKDSANPSEHVKVEMKAIPVSTTASQPIILSASNAMVSLPVENGNWGTVALLVDEEGNTYSIDSSYYDGNGNIAIPVNKANMKVVLQNRAKEFADVPGDINAYPANNIAFLSARGIMSGKGDGTNFDPLGNLTRGQLALMLYRKAGSPKGYNNAALPAGVAADSYYADAAKWAAGTGLMAQGGSAFNGDNAITREQLALILYRQSGSQAVETTALNTYADMASISSDEARNAIAWSVDHKIIGNGSTALSPQDNTKRQDVAAMIARYIQPAIVGIK